MLFALNYGNVRNKHFAYFHILQWNINGFKLSKMSPPRFFPYSKSESFQFCSHYNLWSWFLNLQYRWTWTKWQTAIFNDSNHVYLFCPLLLLVSVLFWAYLMLILYLWTLLPKTKWSSSTIHHLIDKSTSRCWLNRPVTSDSEKLLEMCFSTARYLHFSLTAPIMYCI